MLMFTPLCSWSPIMSQMRLILALLFLLAHAVANAGQAPRKPNVIFILADDLGYTDLACYGSKYYETPNIDRLAAEGMRFTHGYTCGPNCQPTRAALLSGQYGPRTGVYTVGGVDRFDTSARPLVPVDNVVKLPLDRVTLGQAMKRAGYVTGIFGKWHLGEDGEHHPARRGFDEAIVSMGLHFNFKTKPAVKVEPGAYLADFLTDRSVDFIRRHKEKPFFLYLPHFGVHSPFQAKKELIARFEKKPGVGGHKDPTYAAMIASVDESVGRILKTLEELKLDEHTLVIFSSDNGGVGGYAEAGLLAGGGAITINLPLRGGKGMLYEGGVRVPYLFRWKGKIRPGSTSDEPITSVDLYPTLLDLAGGSPDAKQVLDGVSYVPLLTGSKDRLADRALYWHFPGYLGLAKGKGEDERAWRTTPAGAIQVGSWKLLEFFETGRLELYDLAKDVGQKNNLAKSMPERTRELHQRLIAWRQAIAAPMPQRRK
jgi:arylsulfatase A-like enzyme